MQLALSKGWKYTNIELNFEVTCVQITEKNYFHPRSIFWYTYSFYNFRYELFQTKKKKIIIIREKEIFLQVYAESYFSIKKKKKEKESHFHATSRTTEGKNEKHSSWNLNEEEEEEEESALETNDQIVL